MKMRTLLIIFIIVIIIIATGIGIWVLNRNSDMNSDYITFLEPEIGEFVEYTNVDMDALTHNWTLRMTVLSMNSTHMVRNEVIRDSEGSIFVNVTWSAPIQLTFGNGFDINDNMGLSVTVTEVGVENISTQWGIRTCIKYHAVWGNGGLEDFWVHNGVMIKDITPPDYGVEAGVLLLTDTNVPEVTHR